MDKETTAIQGASLYVSSLDGWRNEATSLDCGALIYCRQGGVCLHVNFRTWRLEEDDVIILYPGDMVQATEATDGLLVEVLEYDASLLREACMQLEHTVYSLLRTDRCRGGDRIVSQIVGGIMDLLRLFFDTPGCRCTAGMTLLQLKAFFLGFYDYVQRNPAVATLQTENSRAAALFSQFMELLSENYRESRDVKFYAARMNISAKYLGTIARKVSGHTCKSLIDSYVVMQLKTQLRSSRQSIKELTWQYHFSDNSFFCHYFKQHTGMTPQQYRKMIS